MPFVRFSRDKRGYEHVYLVHSPSDRGPAARARVLYWYRTPPGVKVGRSPFDAATQRAIEARNPGISFDWPQIVAAKIPPPAPVEAWRERRRAERAVKRARSADTGGSAAMPDEIPEVPEVAPDVSADASSELAASPVPQPEEGASAQTPGGGRRRRRRGGRRRPAAGDPAGNGRLDPPAGVPETSNEE